ncbi:hypothetical protein HDU99_002149 [Rhizoclosmatium hyalinum]|nr:hypothetical protein HDU99_002149 [Rhizoclosmatium hyalinum]
MTIRPTLETFDSLVEERIANARRQGQFDELPGRGKPIAFDTDERLNVHLSDTEFFMNRMLKSQNTLPGWVEKHKDIDEDIQKLRIELKNIYAECFRESAPSQSQPNSSLSFGLKALTSWISPSKQTVAQSPPPTSADPPKFAETKEAIWRRRSKEWAELRIPEINARIRDFNLSSPGSSGKKNALNMDVEIERASS